MFSDASCPLPIDETDRVLMGHGSGGKLSAKLLETLILPIFRNPALELLEDQAKLPLPGGETLAFTTDSYVVNPLFFPGGDIGSLAVHGTVNDLCVGGARPLALSMSLILEEGLPLETLERVLRSAREAADRVGVSIVTGDTKVVERGSADRLFINTSGVGLVPPGLRLGSSFVEAGDQIIVSGSLGDHGIAILAKREGLELEGEVRSDSAPLHALTGALLEACPQVHAMRDPTRGGLAATLVETASRAGLGVEIDETSLPIAAPVRGACELLGLDPLLIANEGKLVAFIPEAHADRALSAMRSHPLGREATRVGEVTSTHPGQVWIRTGIGGRRLLDLPFAEPLPRIC